MGSGVGRRPLVIVLVFHGRVDIRLRPVATSVAAIDLARSAERIERDIETLAGSDYTLSDEAIRRYAYTQVYRTLDYFRR